METETIPAAADATSVEAERWAGLARSIKQWGRELGFADVAICDALPSTDDADVVARRTEERLRDWLANGYHGTMEYMARHGMRRARPTELVPGTLSVIAVRMDYLPASVDRDGGDGGDGDGSGGGSGIDDPIAAAPGQLVHGERPEQPWIASSWRTLRAPRRANISRYAHGRDYHKVLRGRLQRLADRIADTVGPFGHRVFTDSAPVMEVELAQRAGLGWRGKHTLLLSRDGGSMFFLGELFVDVPLPADPPVDDHCGTCSRCIDVCPTRAIVAPHVLDARRCISYLTIEHDGAIPLEFRRAIGNRIYGCDDCQLVCPWNRFAQRSPLPDFDVRPLASGTLVEVFAWTETEFLAHTEGSAIRRVGHERWLRNVAVALGNALACDDGTLAARDRETIVEALRGRMVDPSTLVREHVAWALAQDGAIDPVERSATLSAPR